MLGTLWTNGRSSCISWRNRKGLTVDGGNAIRARCKNDPVLVATCNKEHKTELVEYLSKQLLESEPDNSGNYVTISNAYAVEGSWDEVVKMREMMKAKGLKKQPGCSWIRVKREEEEEVQVFVANDKTHLRNNEIRRMLALLLNDMRSDSK